MSDKNIFSSSALLNAAAQAKASDPGKTDALDGISSKTREFNSQTEIKALKKYREEDRKAIERLQKQVLALSKGMPHINFEDING